MAFCMRLGYYRVTISQRRCMPPLICENWPNNMIGQGVKLQQLQEKIDKKKYFLTQDW